MCQADTCGQQKRETGLDLCGVRRFSTKRGDQSVGILEMASRLRRGLLARLAQHVQHARQGQLVLLARPGQLDLQHPQGAGQR